jgi:hypothetical protein
MLLAILLSLNFTLPNEQARTDSIYQNLSICSGESFLPLTDLDSVFVRANLYPPARLDILLYSAPVRGLEGQAYTVNLYLQDADYGTIWVVSTRRGNRSCPSNPYNFNWPLSVLGEHYRKAAVLFYDLQGRRISAPTTPGIYFGRPPGRGTKRIVVVR